MTNEEKRDYFVKMKELCKQLNALIPIKEIEDVNKLNDLLDEMRNSSTDCPHYTMYWDRDVYINSGFNDEKMKALLLHSGKVQFEPNEDPTEHPGVVVRYKSDNQ